MWPLEEILTPNFTGNLPGLFFNVTPELGQQLLLADPVETALHAGNAEEIKNLETTHQDGFWAVLESVMTERGAGANATEVSNTVRCLDLSGILAKKTGAEKPAILEVMRRAAFKVQSWAPFNESVAKGIASLFRFISDPMCSATVLASLRDTIAKEPVDEGTIRGLAHICVEVTKLNHQDGLQPFILAGSADEWIRICPHIYKQGELVWPLLTPQITFNNISTALGTMVTEGRFSRSELEVIMVTHRALAGCDWTSLASNFKERLNVDQTPTNGEINSILEALYLLNKLGCVQAQASLEFLASNGQILHWLYQSHSQGDKECTARLLTAFLVLRPGTGKPATIGNSDAGHSLLSTMLATDDTDMAQMVLKILKTEDQENLLFSVVDNKRTYDPLIVRCLRILTDEAPERLFSPPIIVTRWKQLWDHLNENGDQRFDRLIDHLCSSSSLIEFVQNMEGGFDYKNAFLYFRICKVCPSDTFRQWCRTGLEHLKLAVWKSELPKNDNKTFDLLLFLAAEGISITLKQPFQDALVEHAKGILLGRDIPAQEVITDWPRLLDCLSSTSRKALRRRLLEEATKIDGKCADTFFIIYGDEIAADSTMYYENKEVVGKLFSPLLRERNISGLRWLNGLLQKTPDFLDKSLERDAVDQFFRAHQRGTTKEDR